MFQRSSVVTADSGRASSRSTLKSTDKEGKNKSSKKMVVCRVALLDGTTFEPKGIDVSYWNKVPTKEYGTKYKTETEHISEVEDL